LADLSNIHRALCKLSGINVPVTSAKDSRSFLDNIFSAEEVKGLNKKLYTLAILRQSVSESIRFGSMKVVLHRYRNGTEPTVELYGLTNVLRVASRSPNIVRKLGLKLVQKSGSGKLAISSSLIPPNARMAPTLLH